MNKLTVALKANAAFSTFSGITLILFHNSLAQLFAVDNPMPFWIVGIGLLFFAGTVFLEARQTPKRIKKVQFIIVQDILWVVASMVIIAFQIFSLSTTGYTLIGIVALIVGYFAFAQWKGIQEVQTLKVST